MHPVLFEIPSLFGSGKFPIHTYGVLVALGFLTAIFFIKKECHRRRLNADQIVDFCFSILFIGFIGARFFFVLTMPSYFWNHPLEVFYVWQGGMVFYGGPVFATLYALWFCKKNKFNIFTLGDATMPGFALGHAIGRLGCLAAGCCYGKPCDYPWGVRLHSELVEPMLRSVPLHPTQLYESALLICLFLFLFYKSRKQTFRGQIMLLYFMCYTVLRSIIELFRGDSIRGFIIENYLSTSQFISVILFIIALVAYVHQKKNAK